MPACLRFLCLWNLLTPSPSPSLSPSNAMSAPNAKKKEKRKTGHCNGTFKLPPGKSGAFVLCWLLHFYQTTMLKRQFCIPECWNRNFVVYYCRTPGPSIVAEIINARPWVQGQQKAGSFFSAHCCCCSTLCVDKLFVVVWRPTATVAGAALRTLFSIGINCNNTSWARVSVELPRQVPADNGQSTL